MEPIKFIHLADLHLGKRQYNLQQRYEDFFQAFNWILEFSIKKRVDFILISGDIFDNKNVNPSVLSDVYRIIIDFRQKCEVLFQKTIPIICIEGNHDNPIYAVHSWMTFLADLGLIILLAGEYDKDTKTISFESYSPTKKRGGMIQVKDATIYGLPYYGSFTKYLFPSIKNAISEDKSNYKILLMHFGIEGEDRLKPGIEMTQSLNDLHDKIDYLALGHFHKQFAIPEENPWIFNPGSLEINDLNEINYSRGVFLVEISGKEYYEKKFIAIECDNGNKEQGKIPNREFFQIGSIDISEAVSFEDAINIIVKKVKKWGIKVKTEGSVTDYTDLNCPIISLHIKGEINFSRLEINIRKLREEIKNKFNVLDVRISAKDLFSSLDNLKIEDSSLTLDEIEKRVFKVLIENNPEFNESKEEIINLLFDIKSELIQNKPNYNGLKKSLEDWCALNIEGFKTIQIGMESYKSKEDKQSRVIKEDFIDSLIEKDSQTEIEDEDFYDGFDGLDDAIDDGEDSDEEE